MIRSSHFGASKLTPININWWEVRARNKETLFGGVGSIQFNWKWTKFTALVKNNLFDAIIAIQIELFL